MANHHHGQHRRDQALPRHDLVEVSMNHRWRWVVEMWRGVDHRPMSPVSRSRRSPPMAITRDDIVTAQPSSAITPRFSSQLASCSVDEHDMAQLSCQVTGYLGDWSDEIFRSPALQSLWSNGCIIGNAFSPRPGIKCLPSLVEQHFE